MTATDTTRSSASGTVLSAGGWLDDHFEACREAYAAMVAAAGFERGWRVLDLGSGTGIFTPLLREAVGPEGEVVAVDLDEENVRFGATRDGFAPAVAGSALALPFRDATFDAVWSANLTQYFDDDGLTVLLAEAVRVARPGALVAVKDVDMSALRIAPGSPFLGPHLAEACVTVPPVTAESVGSIRGRALRGWLHRAGLEATSQRTFPIDYAGPLEGAALRLWSAWLPYLAALAEEKGVPSEDLDAWHGLSDPEGALAFVRRPDFTASELQVLAVGRVPETNARGG